VGKVSIGGVFEGVIVAVLSGSGVTVEVGKEVAVEVDVAVNVTVAVGVCVIVAVEVKVGVKEGITLARTGEAVIVGERVMVGVFVSGCVGAGVLLRRSGANRTATSPTQ
jgi:hypothetical protein